MSVEQENAIQELIAGIYIQNLRIYDMLAIIASGVSQTKVLELEKLHAEGTVLCSDPALKLEE